MRLEADLGELEEVGIDRCDLGGEPESHRRAEGAAGGDRSERQGDVVPGHGARGVAERLEHRDLIPLRSDQPSEDEVDQKSGNAEKDRRNQHAGDPRLLDLVGEKAVRDVILPPIGTPSPVGGEQAVEPRQHVGLVGSRGQGDDQVVRGASSPKARRARGAPSRARRTGGCRERCRRRPGSRRRTPATPRCRRCAAPASARRHGRPGGRRGARSVGPGEGVARDHGVVLSRERQATAAQINVIESRTPALRQRDDAAGRRLGQAGHVEQDVGDDTHLERRHSRYRTDLLASEFGTRRAWAKRSAKRCFW